MRAEHVHHARILAAQLPNRLQDRQVRLALPVLFQTLPETDPHAGVGSNTPREGFEQRGLADAGLPRHEHHLALASTRLLQPAVHSRQRMLPPDDAAWEIRETRPWRCRTAGGRAGLTHRRRVFARADLPNEPIAATMRRFDEAGGPGLVGQRLTDLSNCDLEHGIADERVPPDRADQVLFGHELSGPGEQVYEHRERLGPELDGARALPETLVDQVEGERREVDMTFVQHVMNRA